MVRPITNKNSIHMEFLCCNTRLVKFVSQTGFERNKLNQSVLVLSAA